MIYNMQVQLWFYIEILTGQPIFLTVHNVLIGIPSQKDTYVGIEKKKKNH